MIEIYLIATGAIFFAWLFLLVKQAQKGSGADEEIKPRPIVPVNLMDSNEAVIVAEARGRIVYANDQAREWFGIDGGTPNLMLMAQMVQPSDTLHDLIADAGHASFRLGQKRVEAVSHPIPSTEGRRMIVVLREQGATAVQTYTEFDPLRALTILNDMGQVVGSGLDLVSAVDAILHSLDQSIPFDAAELTLWDEDAQMLIPVRHPVKPVQPPDQPLTNYKLDEGYSGWIATYRQPLLITDISTRTDVMPKAVPVDYHSFIGVPLLIGDTLVGSLELLSRARHAFGQRELALLQTIAGPVASTIEAAHLYREQKTRVDELSGLQQIAEAMSQLGEPAELYGQLTQRIAALVDVELCGILLYDEEDEMFRSQPPFYGVPEPLIKHYRLSILPDSWLYAIWRHQPWWFTNEPSSDLIHAMGFEDLTATVSINTLALVPMIVGARRIGLLMVANKHNKQGFVESDMRALMSFASQAAVVVENARLYGDEQRRTRELGGLQQIAQAMGVLRNPNELIGQITQRIATLMNVEMCGVLLYDYKERILVSQRPFYGMDDEESVKFYQLPSPPNSVMARLWQAHDTWFSNDLRRDSLVGDTDLARLAAVVGIRQTLIATLVVGGNRLGIIQASNKRDGQEFGEDDARILSIFAGQAAILIDNARLYREMMRRTHESEGLRAITEIAALVEPISDAVERVIIAIANLLESQAVSIALVDNITGKLLISAENTWGLTVKKPYEIDAYAPGFERSVLVSRRPFMSNSLRDDPNVLPEYRKLAEQFDLQRSVQVPLIIQDRSIGELIVANRDSQYTDADVDLLVAIAPQVAAMIDRVRLYQITDQGLRTRVQELDALSRVTHELSQTIELERVLDVIRQEIMRSTEATATSVILLTSPEDWGSVNDPILEQRFGETVQFPRLAPIERVSIIRHEPTLVEDYTSSEIEALPATALSAVAVPVEFGEEVVGVIHLYSDQAGVFDRQVVNFVQALANQAAIAIGNARRYQEQLATNQRFRIRAERMGRIFELSEMFRQGTSLPELLEEVAHSIQETVGFNVVLISLVDERAQVLRRTAQAGLPLAAFKEMQAKGVPLAQANSVMQPIYRISSSYFVPAESISDLPADLPVYQVLQGRTSTGIRAWDPQDLLAVPLYGSQGHLLGLMTVDEPRSGRRPDQDIVEALEIFASQASFIVENFRLIERIQQEAEATRFERDRLAQLHLVTTQIQRAPDVPSRLQVVANGIHEAGWGRVVITLRDEHLEPTALIQAGYSPEEALTLSDEVQPGKVWRSWISDLSFHELKLGGGYYMRYDQPWVREHLFDGRAPEPPSVPEGEWHPEDVLFLTLVGQDQKRIIGIIAMEDPVDGRIPSEASLQPFELFASQAAAAIETTRLYLETVRAAEQEARVNEVMEAVSTSLNPDAVIEAVGRGLQQMVPFTRMNVALYNASLGHFDVLRADIALDTSMTVRRDRPLKIEKTATGRAFDEMKARIYELERDTKARQNYLDLAAWYESGERSTLIVPMIAGGQPVGVLRLGSELANAFGFQENLELIQRLANLSAVALDNARLFQQATEREQFSAAMRRMSQSLNQIFDLSNVLRTICDESLPILGVEGAYVWLSVGSDLVGIAASGAAQETFSGVTVPMADPVILPSRVVAEGRPIYVNRLQDRDDRAQVAPLSQLQTSSALLGVPLLREDRALGTLMLVQMEEDAAFDDVAVEQASAFAVQAAIAIENARLFEESEQRASELDAQARRLALINLIATRLSQALDPEEIYQIAVTELQEALNASYAGLIIYENADEGVLMLGTHPADAEQQGKLRISLHDEAVNYVRRTRKLVISENIETDPKLATTRHVLRKRGTRSLMIVPLTVSEQVIGTIGLDFTERRTFTDVEIELAETIASQVSVALDKAQLLKEAEARARELDQQAQRLTFLNRISQKLSQTLVPLEIYRIVLHELQDALHVQSSGLMIQQTEDQWKLALSTHPMDPEVPNLTMSVKENPIAMYVLETQQHVAMEDLLNDERFRAMWEVQRARNTAAMLIVPVILAGRVIGTIGLDSSTPRHFTDAEVELAKTTANQAAVAIEKGRLFTEAQERAVELDEQAQRLALINRVSTRLAQTLDPQEIYTIVLSELAETLHAQFAGLVLFESEEMGRLVMDYPFDHEPPNYTLSLKGNRSIEFVRKTLKPLSSEDVLNDPAFEPAWEMLRQRGTLSLMIVPLVVSEQVLGTIGLDWTVRHAFSNAEMELAETIASQASLAIEKARLYNETLGLTIFNQAVVESIQQGIVVLDMNLNVRRVNRFMIERYGWETSAVGKALFEYRHDYESFLRKSIVVALGTGEPQVNYDVERVDPSGHRSIRNYYVYPMLEGRNVTGIVLLVEDVTERAALEADLNARAVQMAALSEVSSQITSTLDPNQVINLILDALDRVVPYDGVSLWLRSTERDELFIAAARGYRDADSPKPDDLIGLTVEIPYSPLFREMSEKAQVINALDVNVDERFPYGSAAIYKNWLGAPLISKGKVVGVLTLEKREKNYYSTLHEQLALTFANQAAVALDNAQLFQETRARAGALDEQAQRLALLNRVSLALAQSLDLENIFEIALRETAIALDVPEGSALHIDSGNRLGQVIVEYPRGDAPPERIYDLAENEAISRVQIGLLPIALEDLDRDPLAEYIRPLMRRQDVKSTLMVPLVVGGNVIGILRLDSPEVQRHFGAAQIELAQTIASQAAIAVQNAALFEQASIRTSELETLFESAQATAVTLDLNEVVRRVTIQMLSALRTDACTVFVWNEVGNQLEVRGDISARPDDMAAVQIGDTYDLRSYPLRAHAVQDRELVIVRLDDPDIPDGELQLMQRHHAASRMLIPLVVNEISIGLVEVETLDPNRFFKPEDVRLARTLASQAAISIENARLQTETRRTVEELYVINDMSAALSSAIDLDELLQTVELQLPNLTDAPIIYVALYNEAHDMISFPLAMENDEPMNLPDRPMGHDEFAHIIRQQTPLLLAGENLDQVRSNLKIETAMPEARCFLGVPLSGGEETIGVLAVRNDDNPMAFTHNDQRILTTVGSQLGVAIQSKRLFQQTLQLAAELEQRVHERTSELEQERQHISTLYAITTELATSLDMERLLTRALEMVAQSVGADQGAILAIDPLSDRLYFRARVGWPVSHADGEDYLDLDQGLAGWAVQNREDMIVDDVQQDSRWIRRDETDDLPRAGMFALIEANEDILGVIMLYSLRPGAFTQDHLKLVTAAAHQVANAMNNAELYSLIRDQAERLGSMLRQEQVEATKNASILDSVADGVVVADSEGQIILFNTAAERILGVPANRVLNRSTAALAGLYGAGSWAETVSLWMREPTDYQPGEFLEDRITLEDNRVISVRLSPVHMGDQFLGTVSVFRDITRDVEVDRLKSEFVATVSHELRTPMTSIKGYADLLLLGAAGDVSDQQQRFLETIKQNADRLSILVNDLLDISRIDQGRVEMKTGLVEVEDVVNVIAGHLRGRVEDEKRPMDIVVELPEDRNLMIWGDYDKIMRIFSNVADNAFNYTRPGGTITLSAFPNEDGGRVIVAIKDTGVGIPPEAADRVFERFFRGDEVQEVVMDTPGTGLGLAIVRQLVQMHNGNIWFDSEVGKGTTFFIELPSKAPVEATRAV